MNLANEAVNSLRTSVAHAGMVLKNSDNHKNNSSNCIQHFKLGVAAQASNIGTWELEARRSGVQGQPWQSSELRPTSGAMGDPGLTNKSTNKKNKQKTNAYRQDPKWSMQE